MRLIELQLRNFRQHVDTAIRFQRGLTGIVGPNGAGKSTLLEGIAWAIYGAEAARGTNETLRFSRAGPRARVEVELRFGLGDREYRVIRSVTGAEAFLDGRPEPVATGLAGVSRYLERRLGMSRREFFNTYFTGQKELQFLAAMGPTERGRFLSTVLGYERLRQAQDLARQRRSELRHEVEGLRKGLGDLGEIRAERNAADALVREAQARALEAEREHSLAAERLAEIGPRWANLQAARERFRELGHLIEQVERERDAARREIARIGSELERVSTADRELAEMRKELAPLSDVAQECERMSQLARRSERARALREQLAELEKALAESQERLSRLEQAPELARKYTQELETLREQCTAATAELEDRKTAWLRDRQDADTKLQSFRERGAELQEQIRQVRAAGAEGECPTCRRPLGEDYTRLLAELEEQQTEIAQDGRWWKSRQEQLAETPEAVTELSERVAALETAIDDRSRKLARCEVAEQELEGLRNGRGRQTARAESLRKELEEIPGGYDPQAHAAAEERLRALRALETRAARLEETAGRREGLERERTEAQRREAAAASRGVEAAMEREALGFSEAAYTDLRAAQEDATEAARRAEVASAEARGQLAAARQRATAAEKAEEQYIERAREITSRETDLLHHNELDLALTQLRTDLNTQVRPELSEIASLFLTQLTDGRYTALDIDDQYNLKVLDEGEEKPIISGGEEDVTNLVLRLSLSQMIADRAGQPLSLLILDEVFGSLDVARRDNVVQLLRRLDDRFEQVVLITHVEGLRESFDHCLRVSFDERTGASVVREEHGPPDGGGESLDGMAAD